MAAAIQDRNTLKRDGITRSFPVAANALLYAGVIAVLQSGNLTKGVTGTGLICVGVTQQRIDNTGGLAGAIVGETQTGVFGPFANSAAGDQITLADVQATCFIVDDQTVAKTNGTNTRSAAGTVFDVSAAGVWVKFA
jgi:hypothetical protein